MVKYRGGDSTDSSLLTAVITAPSKTSSSALSEWLAARDDAIANLTVPYGAPLPKLKLGVF